MQTQADGEHVHTAVSKGLKVRETPGSEGRGWGEADGEKAVGEVGEGRREGGGFICSFICSFLPPEYFFYLLFLLSVALHVVNHFVPLFTPHFLSVFLLFTLTHDFLLVLSCFLSPLLLCTLLPLHSCTTPGHPAFLLLSCILSLYPCAF